MKLKMREAREIPCCLNRRYQALDNLIEELSSAIPQRCSDAECHTATDPSIKLMCDFWNILKEDPDCDLQHAVQQRMCASRKSSGCFHQRVTCYMATENQAKKKSSQSDSNKSKCCSPGAASSVASRDTVPLSKVLCNLKEAASYDKQCNARLKELLTTEKRLQEQVKVLEKREKDGGLMLKQADCMWSCMEESYKKKLTECLERQKNLLTQLKEVEKSTTKWRKNKKDLESQLNSIYKCQEEITGKINQKTNDMKCMDKEIEDYKKRIESNKKDTDSTKASLAKKKTASDVKISKIAAQMKTIDNSLHEERNRKKEKETEGRQYIKESRVDLQKICKVLLQKKLENEDLSAEKNALIEEINILKTSCDTCKDRCKTKQQSVLDQIKQVQEDINNFTRKCIKCHECTDTDDVRKFCTDCPKCLNERDCIYSEDHCTPDHTMDCVCQTVKRKFLDNVFDNMYTVLDKQSKTKPGKAVAEAVLACLKRSTNGKLNEETRQVLQDFILTTVKKNLNLTIVGGAVKTRCEMEPEIYTQLMTCLKKIKATNAPKVDVGTAAKKESCRRWGGPGECNCPKGPKDCICTKRAPPALDDPTPCPPPDKEDAGAKVVCPHKKNTSCGPDCGARDATDMVGKDVAAWKPDPCRGPTCSFKNMRAAQCVLGPELLGPVRGYKTAIPVEPEMFGHEYKKSGIARKNVAGLEDQITCECENNPAKIGTCQDHRTRPRQRMIEEVLGRYGEVTPIEKVTKDESWSSDSESNMGRSNKEGYACSNNNIITPNTSYKSSSQFSVFASKGVPVGERNFTQDSLPKTTFYNYSEPKMCNTALKASDLDSKPKDNSILHKKDDIKVILNPKYKDGTLLPDRLDSIQSSSSIYDKNTNYGKVVNGSTVKDLIKDIMMTDELTSQNRETNSNIESTLESFMHQVVSLAKTSQNSNEPINDVEVKPDLKKPVKLGAVNGKDMVNKQKLKTIIVNILNNISPTKEINDAKYLTSVNSDLLCMYCLQQSDIGNSSIAYDKKVDNVERRISYLYNTYEKLKKFKENINNKSNVTQESVEKMDKEINYFDHIYETIFAMQKRNEKNRQNKTYNVLNNKMKI